MSDDVETSRRDYKPPHSSKHPIPTIQGYKDAKEKEREQLEEGNGSASQLPSQGRGQDAYQESHAQHPSQPDETHEGKLEHGDLKDTSQVDLGAGDPKTRRKHMKHRKDERAEREVTDPVTHLPVTIRDFMNADLKEQQNENTNEEHRKRGVKDDGMNNTHSSARSNSEFMQGTSNQMSSPEWLDKVFPPPSFQEASGDLRELYGRGMLITASIVIPICAGTVWISFSILHGGSGHNWFGVRSISALVLCVIATAACSVVAIGMQQWMEKKVKDIWEDEVWEAQRKHARQRLHSEEPETTMWFNKFIGSIWPLINPDLFANLADTLEDVMQASLPSLVRMVSVEDLGQGSDAIRFLGIRWLPKGAADRSVDTKGNLAQMSDKKKEGRGDRAKAQRISTGADEDASKDANDRSAGAEDEDDDQNKGQESGIAAGMEPEEGEFVNMEIAFAYRATHAKGRMRDRAKHAHLYLAFYLPGNIKIPVWVELRGLIGTVRTRMQITPDPPFVQLCTLTFLGQPKVDISCVPLVKHGLNLMDVPLISNFVQSAVDAAMAQYVAPKSYTLDLKAMLSGDDFKKDTAARGVLVIRIKRAFDYKASDAHIPILRKGSSDPYVSAGWAKFGKPLWSTRVLVDEMHAYFDEECHLLVGPEELDAEENLRVQLWDSDRTTADDDLGRIEIPIKHLMRNEKSNGKMWDRIDSFQALAKGESMPGRLEWSVGYYTKTRLMDYQVKHACEDKSIQTVKQLREKSYEQSKDKLREASHDESAEVEQLQQEDFQETAIDIISRAPPSEDYPSGILSIQVHQIVGLELEKQNRPRDADGGEPDMNEEEDDDRLPDSYCTIILNDNQIYKTRTKPKSSNPFFNAGTERFIRDWRTSSIFIVVRDGRVHEDDPLLGVVHIPLGPSLRSQAASRFDGFHPLAGGIGYGRVRVSLVFRSIQLQAPPRSLGWDYGTLEIEPEVTCLADLPQELRSHRLTFRTSMAKGKMQASGSHHGKGEGKWTEKHGRPLRLPVRNRYAQNLVIEFRAHSTFRDKTPAFVVLWLHSIPDDEPQDLELIVWKGDLARASTNILPGELTGEKLGILRVKLTFYRGLGKWHTSLAKHSPHVQNMLEVLDAANDENLIDCVVGDDTWLQKRARGELDDGIGEVNGPSDSDSSDEGTGGKEDGADGIVTGTHHGHPEAEGRELARANKENEKEHHHGTVGGLIDDIKEYAKNKTEVHRKHSGIMQWKASNPDPKTKSIDVNPLHALRKLVPHRSSSNDHRDHHKHFYALLKRVNGRLSQAPRTLNWVKHKTGHAIDKIEAKFEHRERKPGVETEA